MNFSRTKRSRRFQNKDFFVLYFMDYLLLRTFDNYINASITLARLDEDGISCHLKDEYTVTIDPFLSNAVGGIKLMVLQDDIDRAKEILAGYDKHYREAISCPKCGSHDVEYISRSGVKKWLASIISRIVSSYGTAAEQVYHCYECAFEFTELPEEPTEESV